MPSKVVFVRGEKITDQKKLVPASVRMDCHNQQTFPFFPFKLQGFIFTLYSSFRHFYKLDDFSRKSLKAICKRVPRDRDSKHPASLECVEFTKPFIGKARQSQWSSKNEGIATLSMAPSLRNLENKWLAQLGTFWRTEPARTCLVKPFNEKLLFYAQNRGLTPLFKLDDPHFSFIKIPKVFAMSHTVEQSMPNTEALVEHERESRGKNVPAITSETSITSSLTRFRPFIHLPNPTSLRLAVPSKKKRMTLWKTEGED